jgi:hypothetical protein
MSRRVWFAIGASVLVAVGVVAFLSFQGVSTSGTPAQQLSRWAADTTLAQHLGALHDDALDLDKVLAHHSGSGAVHTVCSVLSVTAEAANAELPSPTTALTQLLAKAYALEYEAAGYCTTGAVDKQRLAKSAATRAQAERVIAQALAQVAAVTGRTPATTTTTQPTAGTGIFG